MRNNNLKIGVIGLGDIAQKAYLPIITRKEDIELVLSTRNKKVLDKLYNELKITRNIISSKCAEKCRNFKKSVGN